MPARNPGPLTVCLCLLAGLRAAHAQGIVGPAILSVDPGGNQADGDSSSPALAAGARAVAFVSAARNLVRDDSNGVSDVFVRFPSSGVTLRASVGVAGAEPDAPSDQPGISLRGAHVAFRSLASLHPRDENRFADIYLRDLERELTELVSIGARGEPADGDSSGPPALDETGRQVAFLSVAGNLTAARGNGKAQVYLRDMEKGTTELVSLNPEGLPGGGDCLSAAMSRDASLVAFASAAGDLVKEDRNGLPDVFLRDRRSGKTTLVSAAPGGLPADGPSDSSAISADGRLIAFASLAGNLLRADRDGRWDIYLLDRGTGLLELASPGGSEGGDSLQPSIGLDGRVVAFHGSAQLVGQDRNRHDDAYIYDRATGGVALVSRGAGGEAANGDSKSARVSEGAPLVVFESAADDIVKDENRRRDIFGVLGGAAPVQRFPLSGDLLFRLQGGRIVQLRPDGSWTGRALLTGPDPPNAFAIDNHGVLWTLSRSGAARRFRSDDLSDLGGGFTLQALVGAQPPLVAADGLAFVATPTLAHRFDARGSLLSAGLGRAVERIALALDPHQNLWAAALMPDGRTFIFGMDRELRVRRSFRASLRTDRLVSDHLGNLLGIGPDSVVKYSPAGTELYRFAAPGPSALAVDGRGNAAVVHTKGVTWLDPSGAVVFDQPASVSLGDVALDGQGRAWVTRNGGSTALRVDAAARAAVDFPLSVAGAGATSDVELGGDRSGFIAANVSDQRGDADGDGLLNRIEIESGLDPLSDRSPPPERRVLPVKELSAVAAGPNRVVLAWSNPVAYRSIRVLRDGKPLPGSPFDGAVSRVDDDRAPGGPHRYQVLGSTEAGPGGGQVGESPVVTAVVVVGDGSEKASIESLDQPYALALLPANPARVLVSSSLPELPVFRVTATSLAPDDTIFPNPAPGSEIRGIEHDAAASRVLFLVSDGRVFRSNLDGSGAALLLTLTGGPPLSPTGYTSLSRAGDVLFTLLGPGYDCLVGFQAGNGQFDSESNLTAVLGFPVEQSTGLHILGDRALVGIGEDGSQSITDAFQLRFTPGGLADAGVNMPLNATDSALITDIEYAPGLGLLAVDATNRRLCLLEADLDRSPAIQSIEPRTGPAAGGIPVAIEALNLRSQADTRVLFGGTEAAIQSFAAPRVTAVLPPRAPGAARVEVITSDGRSFVDPGFTWVDSRLFVRGNLDGLGPPNITDAVNILGSIFLGNFTIDCTDAADVDDSGKLNITDPVNLLSFLFLGAAAPAEPFPEPGVDPTPDGLVCP